MRQYLGDLGRSFGQAWNRFWFTPRDPLVLSVIRVAAGLVALYLVASYSPDLGRFFGPGGLLPVETVEALQRPDPETMPRRWRFSYLDYMQSGSDLWLAHVAGLAVLGLYTVGFWTRISSCLALVVVLSYVHRGPVLTGEVEPVLALVMFYLCLAPSGRYLSVDAWLARRRAANIPRTESAPAGASNLSTAATIATRLMQVHLSLLYAGMALGKLAGDAWWSGAAVWWLIARPEQRLVDLTWLADHPFVVNAWTHAIVVFELTFAVLIWNRLARPLLLWLAAAMWILLVPITGLAAFALLMLAANLSFVPPDTVRRAFSCCASLVDPPAPARQP
jgi:hypothetical protein